MTEDASTDPPSRHGWGPGLLVWPFLGFVLYALSVGPVAKWCPTPPREVQLIYAPLAYSYQHLPPVKAFYDWYAGLWGVQL